MKKGIHFILILFTQICISQTWTTVAPIPEAIRAGNTASYKSNEDGFLFVVSGRNQDGIITTSNQKYQLSTNTWATLAPHPTGVIGASTAILGDTLYTIGGLVTTPGSATRKVHKYSINQNTWSLASNFPVNIVDTDAVAYQDSLIYVVAGYSNKVRVYNSYTNTWRNATSMTPTTQSISWGALTVKNDTLVYMCGADNFLSTNYFNTVRIGVIDQANRANIIWSEATPFPGQTRTFFDAHPWENGIIMTGGSTDNTFGTFSNECYHYNVGTDTWTVLPSKPTAWLTGNSGSLLIDNQWKLICAGGYNTEYLYNTEIFSSPSLSDTNFNYQNCDWKNFNFKQNEIKFCTENNVELEIVLYNLQGSIIKSIPIKKYFKGENSIVNNESIFPNGVYLCKISNGFESQTRKIIITN